MKDGIKEILSRDNIHIIECDENWCNAYGYEKSQLKEDLLDYITNLQDTLQDREEYIGHLEELCNKYEEEHSTEFKIWKDERYQLLDYKSRNEKAIEYIKSLCYIESKNEWFTYGDDLSPEHIVNILNGGDEE